MDWRELIEKPHRRRNPLTGDWVLVSPQRTRRPWQGQEDPPQAVAPEYDPACYLCPGNSRAGAARNPDYTGTFVFDNDFPALWPEAGSAAGGSGEGLFSAESEAGVCRVVCFSPRHDLTLAHMTTPEIGTVVDVWTEQYTQLGALEWIRHVQIFENRGAMMGASNPHPHCQIWANQTIPSVPARELQCQQQYYAANSRCLLCDYAAREAALGERIVCENDAFIVLVPFWAVWPFETMLLPRRHIASLPELNDGERTHLADILRRINIRYDNLFRTPFPNSFGFHQRPTGGAAHPAWHMHAHFMPPLLRSATVRKFSVGYEFLAMPQRDITPELAAEQLRALSEVHYRTRAR